MAKRARSRSLVLRYLLGIYGLVIVSVGVTLLLQRSTPDQPGRVLGCALLICLPFASLVLHHELKDVLGLFRALTGTVVSYRDGDYSSSLAWPRQDVLGELVQAHNALGDVLREERLALVQRELLLDTMVQNTPVAMLLVVGGDTIVFANLAARRLLNAGKKLNGCSLGAVLQAAAAPFREAAERAGDTLFSVATSDEDEVYHLARRSFQLNGRAHELLLLRRLTVELRRQEVQTWKKVIRVISHELNNSLAPIVSLAHSTSELLRRGQYERLPKSLEIIADRAKHLEKFVRGYAEFAKLPNPRLESVDLAEFIARLNTQLEFQVVEPLPEMNLHFDVAQLEQALLNLLKNAHESGSPVEAICVGVRRLPEQVCIEVMDRGSGMSETVLKNALAPFYSTKRSGTGLGLALAREIAEAHGGKITLSNREGGGLSVGLTLPAK